MTLQPGNSFTVVRQIANHLDTDTNYVRAVIRNAYTDAIIDTLNLADKGSQRFKKDWQVPVDSSGQGFYVSIITSVYTDSGYTTKNANYGDEENTYLVQERVKPLMRGGGGLDAYTVRRIVKEELDKLPQPEPVKIPKAPKYEMRWDEVLSAIQNIKMPEQEKVDLAPVISGLKDAMQSIQEKEVTPETDLAPLQSKLEEEMTKLTQVFLTREDEITAKVVEGIKSEVLSQLQNIVKETTFSMAPTTMKMNAPAAKKEEPQPFNLEQLAL